MSDVEASGAVPLAAEPRAKRSRKPAAAGENQPSEVRSVAHDFAESEAKRVAAENRAGEAQAGLDAAHAKIQRLRDELGQYANDLTMWGKTTGQEYPLRRLAELRKFLEENQ